MIGFVFQLIPLWVAIMGEEVLVEFNRVNEESVTFPVEISEGVHINSAIWSLLPTKTIVAVMRPDKDLEIKSTQFMGRLSIPPGSYSLTMEHLTVADSGHYMLKMYTDSDPIQMDYKLQVFRKLDPPEIEVLSNVTSAEGICRIKIKCILKDVERPVTYSWKRCTGHTKEREESFLHLQLTSKDGAIDCTCVARDHVSESYKVIHPMSLCDTGAMGNSGGDSVAADSGLLRSIIISFIVLILCLEI